MLVGLIWLPGRSEICHSKIAISRVDANIHIRILTKYGVGVIAASIRLQRKPKEGEMYHHQYLAQKYLNERDQARAWKKVWKQAAKKHRFWRGQLRIARNLAMNDAYTWRAEAKRLAEYITNEMTIEMSDMEPIDREMHAEAIRTLKELDEAK